MSMPLIPTPGNPAPMPQVPSTARPVPMPEVPSPGAGGEDSE